MTDQELEGAARLHRADDHVQEMLILAQRLRESYGGELDDEAILAVSEATGASPEYVRVALSTVAEKKKQSLTAKVRSVFLSLDPAIRRYVTSGWLAMGVGLAGAVKAAKGDPTSLLTMTQMLLAVAALYNCGRCKDSKTSALSGAIFGGLSILSTSLFIAVFSLFTGVLIGPHPALLLIFSVVGALLGGLAKRVFNQSLRKLGVHDPATERQELLKELVSLQDKLRSNEQSMAFLCVDVVGSTKIKQVADPLAVEFTFNEYHQFVETIVRRHGGTVHSTAGDGVTCAFDQPSQAFSAARNIQSGLIELNTHRNRVGTPLKLRAAIHHGTVVAPDTDAKSINYAHVIDIASHLQRLCPEGCVAVSESAALMIPGGSSVIGEDHVEFHDVKAVVWKPRSRVSV